jgi:CheY-like chemotaxis protein/predicted regulator of Ras-like GTPase activity (Roadblock/LC7/MglB family)
LISEEYHLVTEYSILIADDDPSTLQLLTDLLKNNGFQVTATSSGTEALEFYKQETPDIVLADLAMPEMNGMQLLGELKKYDPLAKVVIITAYSDKDTVAQAFRLGALEFLEKPLDPQLLISKLQDLLAREDRALEGDLQMMNLASIIQINCEERNQARLTLHHQGKIGVIYFKDGGMIHAETGDLSGDEAIYSLLSWDNGSFRLKMGVEPAIQTIQKSWSALLLEGMRRIDESTAGWSTEWDEAEAEEEDQQPEDTGNQIQKRIVKALSDIRDVQSALICSMDGTVIAQDKSIDPPAEAALGEFVQTKAELISGFMEAGLMERVVLSGSKKWIFMQSQGDNLIILTLAERSSVETVWRSVQTIYKRYRSA